MQYTKLGFHRLFKGGCSQQVPCSLIMTRFVTPILHIAKRLSFLGKTGVSMAFVVKGFRPSPE